MMRVSREAGRARVSWQDANHERHCSFSYHAPVAGKAAGRYAVQDAVCSQQPAPGLATASGSTP